MKITRIRERTLNWRLIAKFTFAALLAIWACPAPAAGKAGFLLDHGTFTCADIYYGIGQPVDYAKAYACFESHAIYEYMIVMQLNGEGVPRNTQKAQALMQAWLQADPDNAKSVDETRMEEVLKERLNDKSLNPPKIDYCKDVGSTTISINFCAAVEDGIEKHAAETAMSAIRATLNPVQAAQWDNIQAAAAAYQKAEGQRLYQQYADGTIRSVAYEGQVSFVRSNFLALMQDAFGAKKLKPATKQQLQKIEADIKAANEADVARYAGENDWLNQADSSNADKQAYAEHVSSYKADVGGAQRSWETLRDLCSNLAASVYTQNGTDWSASMAFAISEVRLMDIKNDPVRPGGG